MKLTTVNDPRPQIIQKIESLTSEITRLEGCIKKEWAEIKDFEHSFEETDAAQKRIINMKSDIRKFITDRGKLNSKLLHYNMFMDGQA
jgi:hypothetical protein